jgi:hypothetical protein
LSIVETQDIYPSGLSISPNNTFGGSMNGVSFQQDAIISYKGWQYVGILTGDRLPAIARRKLGTDTWETVIIPGYYIFSNDRHNIMSIGICPNDGTIHMAFDHHVDALHYVHSNPGMISDPENAVWDASSFSPILDTIGGSRRVSVTYPRFVTTKDGNLLFSYRKGTSSRADSVLFSYDGATSQWTDMGVFILGWGPLDGQEPGVYTGNIDDGNGGFVSYINRNAYFDRLEVDDTGRLHATWTFREKSAGADGGYQTNHDIYYAYSDDNGKTWHNNAGTQIAVTGETYITLESEGIVVVPIEQQRWLINQTTMIADSQGRVHMMARHVPMSEPIDSSVRAYHHYWRDTDGTWYGTRLPTSGGRPKLIADADDNLYLFYNDSQTSIGVTYASASEDWTDWQALNVPGLSSYKVGSEPQLDYNRMKESGIISLFWTDGPVGATWGDPAPLRLLEFRAETSGGGDATYGGFPVLEGGYVDTGDWMGYLYISDAPFIYSYSISGWMYMNEPAPADPGAWIYLLR